MKTKINAVLFALFVAVLLAAPGGVAASAESESCQKPRFSNVGWTDTIATTRTAMAILSAIGYDPVEINLSIPITYASMKNGDIDIYLADWEPSMQNDRAPYVNAGDVEVLEPAAITGAKYTIAVPKYVADAGVRDFADIAAHADKFDSKFYGLEPGDSGGGLILDMISKNAFGLGEFELVESSEQGMLSHVNRSVKRDQWVAFLAWEPHPMNLEYDLVYLTGGDDYFGPDFGGAEIFINVRRGYTQECENVGVFLNNLKFSLAMMNEVMGGILEGEAEPEQVALAWMKKNPADVDKWLAGVSTFDGKDGRAAFRNSLGF
ncbi:MAG: choline ABC transporter substrate-binding protein [Gammaproteobacteria bacterium]